MFSYRMLMRAVIFPTLLVFFTPVPSMAQSLDDLATQFIDLHNQYIQKKMDQAEKDAILSEEIMDLVIDEEYNKLIQIFSDIIAMEKAENTKFDKMNELINSIKQVDIDVYSELFPHYEDILSMHLGYLADSYKARAENYDFVNNSKMAVADYQAIINLNSNSTYGYKIEAEYYINHEEYKAALEDYNKIVELSPENVNGYLERAEVYGYLGDDKRALGDFSKAIEVSHQAPEAYIGRGNYYAGNMDGELALKDYDKAIELAPDAVDGYNARAIFYMAKGQNEEAIADYEKIIELAPNGDKAGKARLMIEMLR